MGIRISRRVVLQRSQYLRFLASEILALLLCFAFMAYRFVYTDPAKYKSLCPPLAKCYSQVLSMQQCFKSYIIFVVDWLYYEVTTSSQFTRYRPTTLDIVHDSWHR